MTWKIFPIYFFGALNHTQPFSKMAVQKLVGVAGGWVEFKFNMVVL